MPGRSDTIEYHCWREGDLYCIWTRYFGGESFGAESTVSYFDAILEFQYKCESVFDEKDLPAAWSNNKRIFHNHK